MEGRRALILASAVAFVLTGCTAVRQKIETAKEFAKEVKPGHQYQAFYMPSGSMLPTIRENDQMLVDKSAYDDAAPQRGDVIIFAPPIPSHNPFVKRILALPGDKLAIRKGTILVNGKPLPHSFPPLHPQYDLTVSNYRIAVDGEPLDPKVADVPPRSHWTAPDRLPPGCYFVVGDNVDNSEDSRVWGCTELHGTFSAGLRKGEPAELVGKVVKIVNLSAH